MLKQFLRILVLEYLQSQIQRPTHLFVDMLHHQQGYLLKELAEMGEITADSFDILIPDVLAGKMQARTNPKDRIYAQIIGTGMLDVALAALALAKVLAAGLPVTEVDMS